MKGFGAVKGEATGIARTPEVNSPHINDEVVVKPSDIAKSVLGGEKS